MNTPVKTRVGDLLYRGDIITQYCGDGEISVSESGVISFDGSGYDRRVDETCWTHPDGGVTARAKGSYTSAYTANCVAVGSYSAAGSRSFRIISGDAELSTLTLDSVEGIAPGMKIAYRLLNNYNVFGSVAVVNQQNQTLTIDGMRRPGRYDERLDDPYLQETGNPAYNPLGNALSVHYGYYRVSPSKEMTPEADGGILDYGLVSQLWVIGRPDLGTQVKIMQDAFANGYGCMAQGSQSHAEGHGTITYGRYSHAEGQYTMAGYDCHAEGQYTWAGSHWSHSDGVNAVANDKQSYVWNGASTQVNFSQFPNEDTYYSNGEGTFNINPRGGIHGFFIGLSSLGNILAAPKDYPGIKKLEEGLKDIQDAFGEYEYTALPEDQQPAVGGFVVYRNGSIQSPFATAQCTGLIPCSPGDMFMVNFKIDNNIAAYCFYDSDQRFMKSANADMTEKAGGGYVWQDYVDVSDHLENGMQQDFVVQAPEGCAYVRFSSRASGVPGGGVNIRKRKVSYATFLGRIDAIERQLAGIGTRLDEIMA